jgi:hypothetical protein
MFLGKQGIFKKGLLKLCLGVKIKATGQNMSRQNNDISFIG